MDVKFLTDKGSGILNEDSYVISNHLFGVFDGASSLIKYVDEQGNTGGKLASQLAKETFENNKNLSLIDSAKLLIDTINKEMTNRHIDISDKPNRWQTSAALMKIKKESIEYLQVGDSPIIILYNDGTKKLLMSSNVSDLQSLLLWKKLSHEQVINSYKENPEIMNQLLAARRNVNVTYGAFNGENTVFDFILHGEIPLKGISHILLFTDGFMLPIKNPEDGEDFASLTELYLKGGLNTVKNKVRELEKIDYSCRIYPRFKPHDDMTAIAITF